MIATDAAAKADKERGPAKDHHRDRRPPDGKYHDQVASMEPAEAQAGCRLGGSAAPRSDTGLNSPVQSTKHKPRGEHRHGQGQGHRDRQHPQRQAAVDKSELPAFLFRPVPVKKPEPQTE